MSAKSDVGEAREALKASTHKKHDQAVDVLLKLLAVNSANPPGDTARLAQEIRSILQVEPGIEVELITDLHPIVNLVAVVRGRTPGRRLVFNGHLDTFAVGDPSAWKTDPFGMVRGDRVYGRGAADMKGGLAAQIVAALRLAEVRDRWNGELVLVLTGDEETAGPHGTQYVLETCAHANGDAMMCADAGSPQVLRFGEKGLIWMTVVAEGTAGHGAHVHLADSAIDRLLTSLTALKTMAQMTVDGPAGVISAIDHAAPISEKFSGSGEAGILKSVTVNIGTINGGTAQNLVAGRAEATVDIRLPAGLSLEGAKAEISRLIGSMPGVRYRIDSETEATITDPDHEIVTRTAAGCAEVLGEPPVSTMRVGSSDAVHFRNRGIASVVCGLTPHNMGGIDENVLVEELQALGEIYSLTAFDYLTGR